jgi:hypothetical protein
MPPCWVSEYSAAPGDDMNSVVATCGTALLHKAGVATSYAMFAVVFAALV